MNSAADAGARGWAGLIPSTVPAGALDFASRRAGRTPAYPRSPAALGHCFVKIIGNFRSRLQFEIRTGGIVLRNAKEQTNWLLDRKRKRFPDSDQQQFPNALTNKKYEVASVTKLANRLVFLAENVISARVRW